MSEVAAVIDSNGLVDWFPKAVFKSTCKMDATNFPFDTQLCSMWFGSWTHPVEEIDLRILEESGLDTHLLEKFSMWDLTSFKNERKLNGGSNVPTFSIITFEFQIARKFSFLNSLLVLPCIILSTLTLIIFCLPPSRPDRNLLAMSLFASFMFLLLMLIGHAPQSSSSTPKLGI